MILQSEIITLAEKHRVPTSTIDKNWVLGHLIAELFRHKWAFENLIFKGGTCLKKCYFPDYRFSEDIDLTLRDESFLFNNKLINTVCNNVTKKTGIQFSEAVIENVLHENKKLGYKTIIRFWGANHKRNQIIPPSYRWHTTIKIEFAFYELMVRPPVFKTITGDYSDMNIMNDVLVPCYSIIEIVAEKFRSLLQRSYPAPRDYFDLWCLTPLLSDNDCVNMIITFQAKIQFKGVSFTSYHDFFEDSNIKKVKQAWENSLAEHLPPDDLPDADTVISDLKLFCNGKNWWKYK